jgi:DNA-binding NarL/FixJ family response regulator
MKTKILLVDDHEVLRSGLRQTLGQISNVEIVGEASSGAAALKLVKELKPQIVFMDIHLPDLNGIEVTRRILNDHSQVKIIIFSSDNARQLVDEALEAGVCGFLSKTCSIDQLSLAIDSANEGRLYLSPDVNSHILADYRRSLAEQAAANPPPLSELDRQLLRFISQGLRNKEISANLSMTTKAVEAYRSRLMKKLGCSTSAELIRYAVREGIAKL